MMRHPIRVECYAGSRADERPRSVTIDGRKHLVARLLGESVEESAVTKERERRYKVMTDQGLALEILRTAQGDWFIESE